MPLKPARPRRLPLPSGPPHESSHMPRSVAPPPLSLTTRALCGGWLAALLLASVGFAACDAEFKLQADAASSGGAGGTVSPPEGGAAGQGGSCGEPCPDDVPSCVDEECVSCRDHSDCDGFCDGERGCVECLDDAHCPASRPICEAGACGGCRNGDDCERFADDLPYCNEASGACVECLPTIPNVCGHGRLCHVERQECVDIDGGTALTCEACVSDAHCLEGHRCVHSGLSGESKYVCLPEAKPACSLAPFVNATQRMDAESGLLVSVCALNTTTCTGFLQFSRAVPGCSEQEDLAAGAEADAACGHPGIDDDARCVPFEDGARCTYTCEHPSDCPCGASCEDGLCSVVADPDSCP